MEMPQIFESKEFGKIRVVEHSGAPWFVGKDVCDCLEIGNSRDAAASLDDDEQGVALGHLVLLAAGYDNCVHACFNSFIYGLAVGGGPPGTLAYPFKAA